MAGAERARTPRVAGVLLAAGLSRRFAGDTPKQLHPIDGTPLVRRTAQVALASKLEQLIVVTGHRSEAVRSALSGLEIEIVHNPVFAEGQAGSVRAGLQAVVPEALAAMFIPCDLPHLDVESIDRLIEVYAASYPPIVVPVVEGRRRSPVLLDSGLFVAVETITGDEGARQLFPGYEEQIAEVVFKSGKAFEDLDRAEGS